MKQCLSQCKTTKHESVFLTKIGVTYASHKTVETMTLTSRYNGKEHNKGNRIKKHNLKL